MADLTGLARQLTRLDETVGEVAFVNRFTGRETWPLTAETMIGIPRLLNLADCLMTAAEDGVPGGFAECGVWRGGACIMAAAALDELGEHRPVWVCDSFQGVPPPSVPQDEGGDLHTWPQLSVSAADVKANFERYGLLSDRVVFVEGWFADSLPGPIGDLAVLRCDGDLYSSTREILSALYHHVQPGGFVIVDDYGVVTGCREATDEFRAERGITEPLRVIEDGVGAVFWRVKEN
jgi:O-methyltransferase